jgi:hypothetical protein
VVSHFLQIQQSLLAVNSEQAPSIGEGFYLHLYRSPSTALWLTAVLFIFPNLDFRFLFV